MPIFVHMKNIILPSLFTTLQPEQGYTIRCSGLFSPFIRPPGPRSGRSMLSHLVLLTNHHVVHCLLSQIQRHQDIYTIRVHMCPSSLKSQRLTARAVTVTRELFICSQHIQRTFRLSHRRPSSREANGLWIESTYSDE